MSITGQRVMLRFASSGRQHGDSQGRHLVDGALRSLKCAQPARSSTGFCRQSVVLKEAVGPAYGLCPLKKKLCHFVGLGPVSTFSLTPYTMLVFDGSSVMADVSPQR